MTEYTDSVSVNRIIGAPAGYVGYDDNAELPFDALESNPYQIILLDEFEKAHRSVQRLFMRAFDEGTITTSRGSTIDSQKPSSLPPPTHHTLLALQSKLDLVTHQKPKQQIYLLLTS